MKFKTCYLHIGTEKTGSTSIQRFLEHNRNELKKHGHYYPSSLGPEKGSHFYLTVYCRRSETFDDLHILSGVTTPEELEDFKVSLRQKVEKEFSYLKGCDTLHVSSENFHSRFLSEEAIENLKSFFEPWVEEFKIIVYLRPQHELALSLYSTAMKVGHTGKQPLPDVGIKSHYYNYNIFLSKWANVFGEENINVRIFQKQALIDNDIISDYMHVSGIDNLPKKNLERIGKENESLSAEALEFLRLINEYLPRFEDNRPANYRKNIAEVLEKLYPGEGLRPEREQITTFYKPFMPSNHKVATRFLGQKKLFNLNFSKYPLHEPKKRLSMEKAFEMFSNIWKQGTYRLDN